MMVILDCRGQLCPQPVVQVRRQILTAPNEQFHVLVNDQVSCDNISRLATNHGYQAVVSEANHAFRIELTPVAPAIKEERRIERGPTVVLIASDQVGQGDPQLGQVLMKNFLFTLAEGENTPDMMLFLNGGAWLTVTGSEVLEPLGKLAGRGTEIATCGLCLEFFGLKETLEVGRISNMLEITSVLQSAGRIIRP